MTRHIDQAGPIRRQWARRLARMTALALALQAHPLVAQADTHAHDARGEGAPRLGTVAFPTSANARAQAAFLRGIAYLHSFHYEEAAKAFQAAERADTAFALPYWFEAFTHSHSLWKEDDPKAARQVLARLEPTLQARLARAATPRERAYGAAIEAFFADTSMEVRARAFADSMRSLTSLYPDDLEAAAFTSLALVIAIGENAYPPDIKKARAKQMVERAEHVFRTNPNHPGAPHYLIHISDEDPSFTTSALPAARAYARIAPDASHALHMPSHVFLRLGLWDEVAASNERSWAAWRREMVRDHLSGADLDSHSLLFLSYAYLESGRWRAARALVDSARRVIGNADISAASHIDGRYAVSNLAFLAAAQTGRWNDAVLPPTAKRPAQNGREQFFAMRADYERVVIQGVRGDTAALAAGAATFRSRADSAGGRAPPAFDALASQLEGLLAQARGDRSRAIERFSHAGDFEDQIPIVGPPSFLFARELLGAEYMKAGRADSAAAQFERVLAHVPNRSASLLGLARARVAMGDRDAAIKSYTQLLTIWKRADADVPALAEVRAGAAGRFRPAAVGGNDAVGDDIRFAVLPLPEQLQSGATVMRIESPGRRVVVRQGSNGMVCMRVVPGEAAWDARCYEATMIRLMFRVGDLLRSGLTSDSLDARITADVRAGTLTLPAHPAAGYRVLGPQDAYVPATGAVTAQMNRWQSLHVPFATAVSMGLPDESTVSDLQRTQMPYVMASGTWWSHVMIEHPAGPTR